MQHWGERLEEALEFRGRVKAMALAHALNVSESTVSRWRKGESISIMHAVDLCRYLNVSMDWLFLGHQFGNESYPTAHTRIAIEIQRNIQEHSPRIGNAILNLLECLSEKNRR